MRERVKHYFNHFYSKCFYSNCLFECLKAKILNFNGTVIIVIRHNIFPHFMWVSIGSGYISDFHSRNKLKWYQLLLYKGYIRHTDLQVWFDYRNKVNERDGCCGGRL